MSTNPLQEIHKYGQSIWLDFIRRHMLEAEKLEMLVEGDGVRGVTSNPSIFEKAISGSHDYDEYIAAMSAEGKTATEIYQALTVEDVQRAADIFRPLYDQTNGQDGYVSLEVSPHLARDTHGTVEEARRLWSELDRPNVLIKVPATEEGLPAISTLISEGINVNVTLLFSLPRYREVAEAYLSGLEARIAEGLPVDRVASVASFFLSRIDVLLDPQLEKLIKMSEGERARLAAQAHGQIAIASARQAYQMYEQLFTSQRFQALAEAGAKRQRLLWASTSTKNPAYSDVKYVEALIGPETVNTIPMETLNAYRDHGDPQPRLETNLDEAWQVLDALPDLGIDLEQATDQLEHVGILKFTRSFDRLMESIEQKRAHGTQATHKGAHFNLGTYKGAYDMRLHDLQVSNGVERLWQKDPTLWAQDKIAHAQIRQALGWLHVAEKMKHHLPELKQFGEQVKEERFEKVVHMGMGGSSLAPILFARLFSSMDTGLPVTVLDSTDPEVILGLERSLDLEHTLFIMASKSGETAETLAFGDYFYEKVHALKGEQAGENFVAITDPGSHLVEIGHARRFRKVFLNYADIGGRYSALSFFGLVPAALGGVDVEELLNRALAMVHACQDEVPYDENPGLTLGVALGALALKGRDKVTFVMPETLHPFGMWLEQLLAESTGKQGSGVLPVEGEILGEPAVYGDDRLFVHIDLAHEPFEGSNRMRKLEKAGHPVIYIRMQDRMDLGKEFFRWEFATAVLGSVLRINAFNQPNVQESKDNTERMLAAFEAEGSLPEREPLLTETGIELSTKEVYGDLEVSIAEFLLEAKPGDYIALMAYLPERPEYTQLLQDIRTLVRDWLHTATTLGYGPRFLHSTGQMHKGGPNTGLFIQFSMRHNHDLEIPDRPYTFGVLEKAQYLGDYEALQNHDRRVMRLNLGKDPLEGLKHCKELIEVGSRSLALANRAARRDHMEHRLKEGT